MREADEMGTPLTGGRQTSGVVRIGDTVRRRRSPHPDLVGRLLQHLESRGFAGAPRYLGIDAAGREVFTYLPGEVPSDLGAMSGLQLTQAARLLRAWHDATSDFDGLEGHEVVCHGDASPCNCVFADGVPYAFIDFDDAHPGDRLQDLGYAAWLWLDIGNEELAADLQRERLYRFFADYGLSSAANPIRAVTAAQARHVSHSSLPVAVRQWSQACWDWTRRQRWD
jgi:aminoglycoside phosphotransferase (APT) family kinase protein